MDNIDTEKLKNTSTRILLGSLTVFFLIIFFPIGLVLMWLLKMWSTKARIIVTVSIILLFGLAYYSGTQIIEKRKASYSDSYEVMEKKESGDGSTSARILSKNYTIDSYVTYIEEFCEFVAEHEDADSVIIFQTKEAYEIFSKVMGGGESANISRDEGKAYLEGYLGTYDGRDFKFAEHHQEKLDKRKMASKISSQLDGDLEDGKDEAEDIFDKAKDDNDEGVVAAKITPGETLTLHINIIPLGMIKSGTEELNMKISQCSKEIFEETAQIKKISYNIFLRYTDASGNSEWQLALICVVSRDKFEKINWDRFLFKDLPKVADSYEPLRNIK